MSEDCRGSFKQKPDKPTTVPGHENWYQANHGKSDDQPRNKEFSHGYGSRYEYPLPVVPNAPVPSQANYEPENVAWLIEFFGEVTGRDKSTLAFRYENNTPLDCSDDIIVKHPMDKNYLPEHRKCKKKSDAMKRYEDRAKKSKLLKLYQDNSPANIEYFKPLCPGLNPPEE